ncbi:MAG: SDR family oxidoreductase [Gammaproteobacteria bacterium]|nr:SDR family oxidoreductase [Gammaproteobacteria bacterium]
MKGLEGKVFVITGAGSGIGRGIALRLAEEKARIGIIDLNADGAAETAGMIERAGAMAFSAPADIVSYEAVVEAVNAIEAALGLVHGLVNNAGWDQAMPFLVTDTALWKKIIDINLYGPLNLHHIVVPRMIERGIGRVVNIASDAGRNGSSGEAVYSACKAGVTAFGKTLCREVSRKGVIINTVCPGPSDTPLFASFAGEGEQGARLRAGLEKAIPLGRLGQPEDIAGMVAFLLSDEAGFIVGQTISVSGGLTMHG